MKDKVFKEADEQFPIEYMTEYEIKECDVVLHSKAAIIHAMKQLGIKSLKVKKTFYGKEKDILLCLSPVVALTSGDAKYFY